MRNKFKGFLVGIIFTLILSSTIFAGGIKKTIEVTLNSVNLQINGGTVDADNILYDGTTYVPLRIAAEILGKNVEWDQETRTANIVDISKDNFKETPKDIVKTETITYDNGDRYVGKTKNGIRHGEGTYYHNNGDKYLGGWFEGFESGKGIKYFPNGKKQYEIDYLYGTQSGKIKLYSENGSIYEGKTDNGIISSYGVMNFADGSKYEGEHKDYVRHGTGKFSYSNGDYFQGEFRDGILFNGVAKITVNGASNLIYYENGEILPPKNTIKNTQETEIVESRINGEFTGWDGETIFELQNGQIWQQSSYNYRYSYKYSPKVLIYKSGIGYKMKVDGVDDEIWVKRLK